MSPPFQGSSQVIFQPLPHIQKTPKVRKVCMDCEPIPKAAADLSHYFPIRYTPPVPMATWRLACSFSTAVGTSKGEMIWKKRLIVPLTAIAAYPDGSSQPLLSLEL